MSSSMRSSSPIIGSYPLFHLHKQIFTNHLEQNDSDCIVHHSLSENNRENFGELWSFDESQSCYWVGGADGGTILDHERDIELLDVAFGSKRNDPVHLADKKSKPEYDAKWNDSAH